MTRDMAKKIIADENLGYYNFFEEKGLSADAMVIQKKEDKWSVYATSERASKVIYSEYVYDNEEEALDDFIDRLRWLNKRRRKEMKRYYS